MSHESRVRIDPQISIGNLLSIGTMLAVGLAAFFAVRESGAVLAQRVDRIEKQIETGDKRDEDATRAINDVRGAIIELRGELKSQGRSLDRIEKLLEQRAGTPVPSAPRETPSPITPYPRTP